MLRKVFRIYSSNNKLVSEWATHTQAEYELYTKVAPELAQSLQYYANIDVSYSFYIRQEYVLDIKRENDNVG